MSGLLLVAGTARFGVHRRPGRTVTRPEAPGGRSEARGGRSGRSSRAARNRLGRRRVSRSPEPTRRSAQDSARCRRARVSPTYRSRRSSASVLVRLRLADRQRPLLELREEDGIPLEALRPVERQEVDAVGRALAPRRRRGTRSRRGERRGRGRRSRQPPHLRARSASASDAVRSRAAGPPAVVAGHVPHVASARRSSNRCASIGPRAVTGRRRRSRSASRTSGRSKNCCPRTRNGIRAFVRAASIGGIWALIRTRTAISDAGRAAARRRSPECRPPRAPGSTPRGPRAPPPHQGTDGSRAPARTASSARGVSVGPPRPAAGSRAPGSPA